MEAAFDDWLAGNSQRPKPADIRRIALGKLEPIGRELKRRAPEPEPPKLTEEQLAEKRRRAAEIMQGLGDSLRSPTA